MLLWQAIFSLFGATIVEHYISFQGYSKREFTKTWSIYWWMGMCTCLWSRKHEEILIKVTRFDKTQQNDKQHMYKVFSWCMTYDFGRTCLSLRNLPFWTFRKQKPQISSITRTRLHGFIYHIYTHNNLDLDQAWATHRSFKFMATSLT